MGNKVESTENVGRHVGKFATSRALTEMRGRSTQRGPSGSYNHGKSKLRSEKIFKCYNYGKKDHLRKVCWNLNKKDSNPRRNVKNTLVDRDAIVCETAMTI